MPLLDDPAIVTGKKPRVNNFVLIAGISLYAISLCDDAYCTGNGCVQSIMTLLLGWAGVTSGGASISWIANPILIVAWRLLAKNKRNAWLFGLLATIFSLSFLGFKTVIDDEAGNYRTIVKIGISYWFWVASCLVTFIGSVVVRLWAKNEKGKIRVMQLHEMNLNLNIRYDAPNEVWDKVPLIYAQLDGWLGYGKGEELGEKGIPYWFSFDEEEKHIHASAEPGGLHFTGL